MISLRRARLAVLAVPVLLAGCSGGDVLDGTGTVGSGSPSVDFPSGSGSAPDPSGSGGGSSSGSGSSSGTTGGTDQRLARLSTLTGNATSVLLDPAFLKALGALGVTPGLVGTARLTATTVAFPVTGGTLTVYRSGNPTPATGSVRHTGSGLSLSAGTTKLELSDLTFDFGYGPGSSTALATVMVNGQPVAQGLTAFDLDTSAVKTAGSATSAGLAGLSVRVSADLAKVLNAAFRTSAFTSSLVVGSASLLLTGS